MPDAIGNRFIDADKLLGKIQFRQDSALGKWLRRQPRFPELVNSAAAAALLDRAPTHMNRLKDRLPDPVPVEGTDRPLYLKSEIVALAKELERERKSKEKA